MLSFRLDIERRAKTGAESTLQNVSVGALVWAGQNRVDDTRVLAQRPKSVLDVGCNPAIEQSIFHLAAVFSITRRQVAGPPLPEVRCPSDVYNPISIGRQGCDSELERNAHSVMAVWSMQLQGPKSRKPRGRKKNRINTAAAFEMLRQCPV